MGMDWSLREGYSWAEDKEHCEEYGRMLQADPRKVSQRARKRGLPQVSTQILGDVSGSRTTKLTPKLPAIPPFSLGRWVLEITTPRSKLSKKSTMPMLQPKWASRKGTRCVS